MFRAVLSVLAFVPAILAQGFIQEKLASGEPAGTLFGEIGQNVTFDYVVVGGGLAGGVVASRLAEDHETTVAGKSSISDDIRCSSDDQDIVIEPGTFYELTNGNNSQVPYYSLKYIDSEPSDYQPLIDWGLTTEAMPVSTSVCLPV